MENNNRDKRPESNQEEKSSGIDNNLVSIITVVISVVIILLVIWYLANKIIEVTSTNTTQEEVQVTQTETESTEDTSSEEASSSSEEASLAEESNGIPEPLVAGTADWQDPDTWIGKTFVVQDSANVRSGPGTANSIVGGVSVGQEVTVIEADYVDEATWVRAVYTAGDGEEATGWIYSYAIDREPVE